MFFTKMSFLFDFFSFFVISEAETDEINSAPVHCFTPYIPAGAGMGQLEAQSQEPSLGLPGG